jgi:hypothetical protein
MSPDAVPTVALLLTRFWSLKRHRKHDTYILAELVYWITLALRCPPEAHRGALIKGRVQAASSPCHLYWLSSQPTEAGLLMQHHREVGKGELTSGLEPLMTCSLGVCCSPIVRAVRAPLSECRQTPARRYPR